MVRMKNYRIFHKSEKNSILTTLHDTPNHAWANFHQYRMYSMDFLLDEILGNYKEGELPLMQENLSNVENMICPEKSIFLFDRNYNAMELYA